ncbi:hypothetical protein [Paenibacillus campi]|nr:MULTISPECIES: hypothetical protein [unclassified Paenibacillus]
MKKRAYATEMMQYGGMEQLVHKVRVGEVWLSTWKAEPNEQL